MEPLVSSLTAEVARLRKRDGSWMTEPLAGIAYSLEWKGRDTAADRYRSLMAAGWESREAVQEALRQVDMEDLELRARLLL